MNEPDFQDDPDVNLVEDDSGEIGETGEHGGQDVSEAPLSKRLWVWVALLVLAGLVWISATKPKLAPYSSAVLMGPSGYYAERAELADEAGQHEKAVRLIDKSLEYQGWVKFIMDDRHDYLDWKHGLLMNRGMNNLNAENNKEAVDDFTRAIEIFSEYGWAFYDRSLAHEEMGNFQKALDDLEKAEQFGIDEPWQVPEQRCWIYIKMERYLSAIGECEAALEIKETARAYQNLGYAHHNLGNRSQAAEFYREAHRIDKSIELPGYAK